MELYENELRFEVADEEGLKKLKMTETCLKINEAVIKIRGAGEKPIVDADNVEKLAIGTLKSFLSKLEGQWKGIQRESRQKTLDAEAKEKLRKDLNELIERAGGAGATGIVKRVEYLVKVLKGLDPGFIRGEKHYIENDLERLIDAREDMGQKIGTNVDVCKAYNRAGITTADECAKALSAIKEGLESSLTEESLLLANKKLKAELAVISDIKDADRWLVRMDKDIKTSGKKGLFLGLKRSVVDELAPGYINEREFIKVERIFNYFQLLIERAGGMTPNEIRDMAGLIAEEDFKELDKILRAAPVERGRKGELKKKLRWLTWSDERIRQRVRRVLLALGDGEIRDGLHEANRLCRRGEFKRMISHKVKDIYKALQGVGIRVRRSSDRQKVKVVKLDGRERSRLKDVLDLYKIVKE